jgi:uncharacterized membrane protein
MSETAQNNKVAYQRYKPVDINRKHKDNLNFLNRFGVVITRAVGTMITAILFTGLALISLPAAIKTHDKIIIVAWIAQTFLQLVLLPIIMVGQNIQGKHAEVLADEEFKTTESTYQDLEHLILVNKKQLDLLVNLSEAKRA